MCDSSLLTTSVDVSLSVLPQTSFYVSPAYTYNCLGSSVNLAAISNANLVYEWSTGETSSTISVNPSTTTSYWVSATNLQDGCVYYDTAVVVIPNNEQVHFYSIE